MRLRNSSASLTPAHDLLKLYVRVNKSRPKGKC